MAGIFGLLFIVSVGLLFYGRKNPGKVVFWSNNKTPKNAVIGYGAAAIIFLAAGMSTNPAPPSSNSVNGAPASKTQGQDEKFIPGIQAVDVYLNLEKKGFQTKQTTLSLPEGNVRLWKSEFNSGSYQHAVEIYGKSHDRITSIRATSLNFSSGSMSAVSRDFLGYIASAPYDGANQAEARAWVESNIDKSASKTFGGVKFEIIADSPNARILRITVQ